jgi:hypothetical protein
MTCRICKKIGHISTFCENERVSNYKVSTANVQDAEVHEEAVQELLVAEEDYYAYMFLCEEK